MNTTQVNRDSKGNLTVINLLHLTGIIVDFNIVYYLSVTYSLCLLYLEIVSSLHDSSSAVQEERKWHIHNCYCYYYYYGKMFYSFIKMLDGKLIRSTL